MTRVASNDMRYSVGEYPSPVCSWQQHTLQQRISRDEVVGLISGLLLVVRVPGVIRMFIHLSSFFFFRSPVGSERDEGMASVVTLHVDSA